MHSMGISAQGGQCWYTVTEEEQSGENSLKHTVLLVICLAEIKGEDNEELC